MKNITRLAGIIVTAAAAFSFSRMQAAEENEGKSNVVDAHASMKANFDRVDTWIEGVVSAVDSGKGTLTVNGQKLPFATSHAQMRKEFEQKSAGATEEKRNEIAETINRKWRGKLMAAQGESPGAREAFKLKTPATSELMLLERKSVQDMTFAFQPDEGPKSNEMEPNLAGELVSIDIYDIPAKSDITPAAAMPSLSSLSAGDTVKVGFDSSANEALLVIVLSVKQEHGR